MSNREEDLNLVLEEYKIHSEERSQHIKLTLQGGAITSAVVTWVLKIAIVDISEPFLKLIFILGAMCFIGFAFQLGIKVLLPHFKQKSEREAELAERLGFLGSKGRFLKFLVLSNWIFAISFFGIFIVFFYYC